MAAGALIKHKRKAGAFSNGELAAGEWGLDVSGNQWYFSANGTTVIALPTGAGTVNTANSPNANEFARFADADTIEGRTYAETKQDLGLDNVTNESKSTMFASPTFTGTVTVPTPSANDNSTKAASTAYVDAGIAAAVTGLLDFKGSTDCSANPNYPAASKGDSYVVSVAGKIGGASGTVVAIGDVYFATADNAGGTQASVGASWAVLEKNLDGAYVVGGTDVPVTDGGTGASSASGARANLGLEIGVDIPALAHNHAASSITSGDLDTARMQTNVVAAINAVGGTINDSDVVIDGGTI